MLSSCCDTRWASTPSPPPCGVSIICCACAEPTRASVSRNDAPKQANDRSGDEAWAARLARQDSLRLPFVWSTLIRTPHCTSTHSAGGTTRWLARRSLSPGQRTWEAAAGIMCPIPRLLCPMCPMIGDMQGTGNSMLPSCTPLLPATCMPPCDVRNHTASGTCARAMCGSLKSATFARFCFHKCADKSVGTRPAGCPECVCFRRPHELQLQQAIEILPLGKNGFEESPAAAAAAADAAAPRHAGPAGCLGGSLPSTPRWGSPRQRQTCAVTPAPAAAAAGAAPEGAVAAAPVIPTAQGLSASMHRAPALMVQRNSTAKHKAGPRLKTSRMQTVL